MHRTSRAIVTLGLAAGAVMTSASAVSAAPPEDYTGNPNASCVGIIVSEHAHTDGGAADVVRFAKGLAPIVGLSFGQFVSFTAEQHLGTHAICGDEG